MFRKLLYPLICSVVLVSCFEKETDEEDPQPLADCRISSSVAVGGHFSPLATQYEYNEQNQLVKIKITGDTVNWITQFTYNEQGQLSSANDGTYLYEYEYNAQGQLIKQTRSIPRLPDRRESEVYLHTYNSAGQLIETTVHPATEPTAIPYRFKFDYTNGVNTHIEKTTYAYDGSVPNSPPFFVEDITIAYDGKKNLLPASPLNQYYRTMIYAPAPNWHAGNVTSYKIVRRSTGAVVDSYTVAYTYNAQGVPTEAIRTSGNQSVTHNYSYICD